MSDKGLGGQLPVSDEPPHGASDEPAPAFGRWSVWYGLVAIELGLLIALCGWITHRHP